MIRLEKVSKTYRTDKVETLALRAVDFAAVFDATRVHWFMWVVLVAGGLNTVLSLFYYLRVAKIMCIDVRPATARPVSMPSGSPSGMYVMLVSAMVLLLGVVIQPLSRVAHHAAAAFF